MIAHFPVTLLIPGLLFIAAGFFYRDRATHIDDGSDLGKRMREANVKNGNLSIALGFILVAIAVPLALVIRSMVA